MDWGLFFTILGAIMAALLAQLFTFYVNLRMKRKSYLFKCIEKLEYKVTEAIRLARSKIVPEKPEISAYNTLDEINQAIMGVLNKSSIIKIDRKNKYKIKELYFLRTRKSIQKKLDLLIKNMQNNSLKLNEAIDLTNGMAIDWKETFGLLWNLRQNIFELFLSLKTNK